MNFFYIIIPTRIGAGSCKNRFGHENFVRALIFSNSLYIHLTHFFARVQSVHVCPPPLDCRRREGCNFPARGELRSSAVGARPRHCCKVLGGECDQRSGRREGEDTRGWTHERYLPHKSKRRKQRETELYIVLYIPVRV